MIIRLFRESDKKAVIELLVELQDFERKLYPVRDEGVDVAERCFEQISSDIAENAGEIMVAEVDGEIAGFIAYNRDRDFFDKFANVNISDLVVNEKYRGRGIGSALIKEAERFTKEKNIKFLRIGVLDKNPAKNLYKELGFETVGLELEKKID